MSRASDFLNQLNEGPEEEEFSAEVQRRGMTPKPAEAAPTSGYNPDMWDKLIEEMAEDMIGVLTDHLAGAVSEETMGMQVPLALESLAMACEELADYDSDVSPYNSLLNRQIEVIRRAIGACTSLNSKYLRRNAGR